MLLRIIIAALLLASSCADAGVIMRGSGGTPTGDNCTGTTTFVWRAENSFDVEAANNGCSAGDTVGTNTSTTFESANPIAQEGTYSVLFDGVGDKVVFDVTDRDIITEASGTIELYFYLDTFTSGRDIFRVTSSGNDFIHLMLYTNTDNELRFRHRGNGTEQTILTSDCDLVTGEWVHVIAKWTQAAQDPNYYLYCDSATGGTGGGILNDQPTAWAGAPATVILGDGGGFALQGNIDYFRIGNTYE